MWLEQLQNEIALRLDRDQKLADVEAELVDSAVALSDDERAALWLFAWSYRASERHDTGHVLAGLVHE
jgi:GAF domain-containing protein